MADYSLLNDPDMKEIFDSFIVETKELLDKLDLDLVELETRPDDTDLLNEIFRSFHTIKGTSGFLGLEKLQKVTHQCEDLLNKLRKGEAHLNDIIMDTILLSYDTIKTLVLVIEEEKNENYDTTEVLAKLTEVFESLSGDSGEESMEDFDREIQERLKKAQEEEKNSKNVEVIEPKELEEIFEVELDESPVVEENSEIGKIEEGKANVSKQVVAEQKKAPEKKVETTIRVEVERLDELLNIVQELVLGRNRLLQLNTIVAQQYEGTQLSRDLSDATQQIDFMTTELQLAVMKTRMIKIGKVFNKFPRLVRDLSKETGKKVELIIRGEETELDKTLIEEINDPLVHMIRNSIDHGLEPPEEREKIGKDPVGKVTLSAEQEGNNVIISIEDDGRGINPEIILNKAIEKGLISKERASELSKKDIYNLIFLPGFSTAKVVSNVSGRGVGMDVVKTNVLKLRGVIDIESEVGKGSRFIIKLPITLAIIQGLLVKIREETLVVPLNTVIEVVRVGKKEIFKINQNDVIKLRNVVIPLVDLQSNLYKDEEHEEIIWQYVVIVGIAERRFGLKVDKLIGQEEIVIKSLGKYLGNIKGIAGSTIMGDGSVVMIADIAEIVNELEEKKNVD